MLGGAMVLASGVDFHGFTYEIIGLLQTKFLSFLPQLAQEAATLVADTLLLLMGLGGITIMAGGMLMMRGRVTLGKLLVMLGGGAGFIGLAVGLGYAIFSGGLLSVVGHAEFWLGLLLAAIGRRASKAE